MFHGPECLYTGDLLSVYPVPHPVCDGRGVKPPNPETDM